MDFSNEVGGMNLGCGRLLVVPEKKTEQMPVFQHNGESHFKHEEADNVVI